jgi:GDP-mannose transporter
MTVFKNMTNLLIAYGDWYFFDERVTRTVIASFALMMAGSVLTGYYDLEFNALGYSWMSLNCCAQVRPWRCWLPCCEANHTPLQRWPVFSLPLNPTFSRSHQAAYVLYMRQAKKATQLSEWGMSLYNNLLCCGMMIGVTLGTGEFMEVRHCCCSVGLV